ncbi:MULTISPECIES: YdcH family protein [Campylobacter]|uniref:YdcH family protein n=1 Tax=Campylobacter TaxID=194 RepID=UPI00036911A5|nr:MULTISPECIES: DUF465 domain-containing protein [Campylobacter]MBN7288640.1 DUF465 domain-containing protein [Campylobacter curvus]MDU6828312.1 DUF465 domain-containing protein [Campylobacter sp.]QKF61505.1 DUF465 domain-containing protein [Campylobacter curvus]UEB49810.1 DUF465 domain-containing protein [Campylobacter curvus]
MLHEYTDLINELKPKDARFAALCAKHDELNKRIDSKDVPDGAELDTMKKEKLRLKDEIYAAVLKYKETL